MKAHLKRYKLIFPSAHGSWSLMLVPYIIGTGIALSQETTQYAFPGAVLCLLAVFSVFFIRQPIDLLIRIRRGKGRKSDTAPAVFWTIMLGLIASAAGIGLLLLNRQAILWLTVPVVSVLAATQIASMLYGQRQLIVELVGVMGLALGAPAAYISTAGKLDHTAWLVWVICAVHNLISVLYVRLHIDEHHHRATKAQAWWVIIAHVVSLLAVFAGSALEILPWSISIPVAFLLARAVFVARKKPPIQDVKRFGFTEMGLALGFAAIVITSFAIQ